MKKSLFIGLALMSLSTAIVSVPAPRCVIVDAQGKELPKEKQRTLKKTWEDPVNNYAATQSQWAALQLKGLRQTLTPDEQKQLAQLARQSDELFEKQKAMGPFSTWLTKQGYSEKCEHAHFATGLE